MINQSQMTRSVPLLTRTPTVWGKMGLLMFTHLVNDGYSVLLAPILILLALEFQLDVMQTGLLVTVYNLGNTVLQFPISLLADLTGRRRIVLSLGLLLSGAGVGLYGLSPTYGLLLVAAGLGGVAAAGYHPCSMSMVTEFGGERKGFFMGIFTLAGSIGQSLFPLSIGLLAATIGWRSGMLLLAVPGLLSGVLVLACFRQRAPMAAVNRPSLGLLLRTVLRSRPLLTLALFGAFTSSIFFACMTFLPLYLGQKFGWGTAQIGLVLALYNGTALVFQPLVGHLSDRGDRPRLLFTILFLTGLATALLPFLSQPFAVVAAATAAGAAVTSGRPLTFAAGTDYTDPRSTSSTVGFLYSSNMLFGSLAPVIGGLVAKSLSLAHIFWLFGLLAMAASFFMLRMRRYPTWQAD